ncbi:uncharacterized protein V6R79_026136 [Siganus canaliculatus]
MLESHTGGASALNVSKYCDLLSRLGQEFADRFSDFERLEPCVTFMANPFMDVDTSEISGQMAELFCIDPVEMEMEVVQKPSPSSFENVCFVWVHIPESVFSDMNVMKSKFRIRLTDEHLNDSIRVNLSGWRKKRFELRSTAAASEFSSPDELPSPRSYFVQCFDDDLFQHIAIAVN